MDRALMDFAEATKGLNGEMQWSLSEDITRRQIAPVFKRCASGDVTAEQALDVCMDNICTKLANTMRVFEELFQRLTAATERTFGDSTIFFALGEMEEFFLGLHSTAEWSTSEVIARQELLPLFQRCHNGDLDPVQSVNVFIDNIVAKRDYTLTLLQGMCARLAQEIQEVASKEVGVPNAED